MGARQSRAPEVEGEPLVPSRPSTTEEFTVYGERAMLEILQGLVAGSVSPEFRSPELRHLTRDEKDKVTAYLRRQEALREIREVDKMFAETAMEVVRRAVSEEYEEVRKGLSFKLLKPGKAVFIEMAQDFRARRGTERYQWNAATPDHRPEFDTVPTAQMVYPVSSWYWKDLCFTWLFDAGLDMADVLSDLNVVVGFLLNEKSDNIPRWLKQLYIWGTLGSLSTEVLSALYIVCTTEADYRTLGEIHERYPVWRCGRYYPDITIALCWAKFVFLRYLAVPERLVSPHTTFLAHDHLSNKNQGGQNRFLPYEHPDLDLEKDRSELAVCVTDHVRYEYRVVEGYLAKVPKFIVEDIFVCMLAIYMGWLQTSSAAFFASLTGIVSLIRGVWKLYHYIVAARAKRRSLVAYKEAWAREADAAPQSEQARKEADKAKGDLEKFDRNPVRRCIAVRTG